MYLLSNFLHGKKRKNYIFKKANFFVSVTAVLRKFSTFSSS